MPLRVVLQNRHFCFAKPALLKTDINCIGIRVAFNSVSESRLFAYYQPLISQSYCPFFLVILYFVPTAFSTTFFYWTHLYIGIPLANAALACHRRHRMWRFGEWRSLIFDWYSFLFHLKTKSIENATYRNLNGFIWLQIVKHNKKVDLKGRKCKCKK